MVFAIIFHGIFSDKRKGGLRHGNMACSGVSERSEKTITLEANTMFDLKKKQNNISLLIIGSTQIKRNKEMSSYFFLILFHFFH